MNDSELQTEHKRENTPWLSVVCPIYNAEAYIAQCIRSVLRQSLRDFELILVNDGSTDGTERICTRFAARDPRIRYFRKENGGCYQSRLFGAARARGAYLLFCDADDYYLTRRAFQKLFRYVQKYPCEAMQFGAVHRYRHLSWPVRAVSRPLQIPGELFRQEVYPKLVYTTWRDTRLQNYVWNKLYKRDLLRYLPDPDSAEYVFQCEDVLVNLQLLEHCRSFLFVPDAIYVYRALIGGSQRFSPRKMKDMTVVWERQLTIEARRPCDQSGRHQERIYDTIADRVFAYVREAVCAVEGEALRALVAESLALPAMQKARAYFAAHPKETWEPGRLLRENDPEAYIAAAMEKNRSAKHKRTVKSVLLRILRSA